MALPVPGGSIVVRPKNGVLSWAKPTEPASNVANANSRAMPFIAQNSFSVGNLPGESPPVFWGPLEYRFRPHVQGNFAAERYVRDGASRQQRGDRRPWAACRRGATHPVFPSHRALDGGIILKCRVQRLQAARSSNMGIRFFCPNGHKLNVKSFLAGQTGICPYCGIKVEIPTQSTRTPSHKEGEGHDLAATLAAGGAGTVPVHGQAARPCPTAGGPGAASRWAAGRRAAPHGQPQCWRRRRAADGDGLGADADDLGPHGGFRPFDGAGGRRSGSPALRPHRHHRRPASARPTRWPRPPMPCGTCGRDRADNMGRRPPA